MRDGFSPTMVGTTGNQGSVLGCSLHLLRGDTSMFVLRKPRAIALLVVVALGLGACSDDDGDAGSTNTSGSSPVTDAGDSPTTTAAESTGGSADGILAAVQAADSVRCGTRDALPGFAVLEASGDHVGFDADFCKVVAAAVLGDATKVEFVDVETADRFTALQAGSIDVLIRNTTWTASRDGVEGATFLHPNFYDGQGMMVAADSGFASLADMSSAIVCVAKGTTTEGNAAGRVEPSRAGLGDPHVRRHRSDPERVRGRPVRRMVVRHESADRSSQCLPGWRRRADHPAGGLLEGAARTRGRRR